MHVTQTSAVHTAQQHDSAMDQWTEVNALAHYYPHQFQAELRERDDNLGTTAKQVTIVSACVAKGRQHDK